MTTEAEHFAYTDPTDAFGNTLTVAPVDASTYTGTTPVVSLGITVNPMYTDPENPIVYVRLDDLERVVKAIREAAGQPETDEERTDREETERGHAVGDHQYCGASCEVEMPSVLLRNFIVAKGYPGTAGALDELLRRESNARRVLGTTEQADTVAAPAEFELRADTEIRAAAFREAAEVAVRAARSSGGSETGQYAASVAAGIGRDLRRLADEAQQPEPEVAGCKRCGCSPRCCACDFAEAQQPTPAPAEPDMQPEAEVAPVVAWSSVGSLFCTSCCDGHPDYRAARVTSLPQGGTCDGCGTSIPATPAGELQLTGFGLAATGQPVHSVAVTSCPDFPATCPTLTPVPADLPHHYGGIRCGCGDVTTQQPTPAPAKKTSSVGPRCGNNPNITLTPGDQQAVDNFMAYLKRRAAGGPPEATL